MSGSVLVVLLTRVAIGIASGEISIRYFEWWWRIRKDEIASKPILLGVSLAAFSIWGIETTYMIIRSQPRYIEYRELTASSYVFEGLRICLLLSALYLAIPVMLVHYRKNRRQTLIELGVRIFLMGMCILATWEVATIHYCSHLKGC